MQSESATDSLVAVFSYKPLDADVDWSMVAKASPCYVTVRYQYFYLLFVVSMYEVEYFRS